MLRCYPSNLCFRLDQSDPLVLYLRSRLWDPQDPWDPLCRSVQLLPGFQSHPLVREDLSVPSVPSVQLYPYRLQHLLHQ